MPVGLHADAHVPGPVILQLRLRDVDILAATEEGTNRLEDHELLDLVRPMQRVMVTQDIHFRVLAEGWQRQGRPFAGLVFAHQRYVSYGEMIFDLELVAKATDTDFWQTGLNNCRFDIRLRSRDFLLETDVTCPFTNTNCAKVTAKSAAAGLP